MRGAGAGSSTRAPGGGSRTTGVEEHLRRVAAPIGFIYGADSAIADENTAEYLAQTIGRPVPARASGTPHHHVQLDRPAAAAEAVERLLRDLASGDQTTTERHERAVPTRGTAS